MKNVGKWKNGKIERWKNVGKWKNGKIERLKNVGKTLENGKIENVGKLKKRRKNTNPGRKTFLLSGFVYSIILYPSDKIYYRKFLLWCFFRRKPTKPPMPFCKPSAYCIIQDMSFREQALFRPYLALYKESLRPSCKPTSGDKHKKHRKPRLCNKQIKQNVKNAVFFCML